MKKENKSLNQKIDERIEDIEDAKKDLNDRGNLSEEQFQEFNTKIETLEWVLRELKK